MDLFTVGFGPFLGSKCVSGRLYAVALPGRPTPLHRVPVVHADHDRDENWFLLGKALLHELAYLALALVDQTGRLPHLADDSDIGGFGIGLLEAISEPFGHGIADHDPHLGRGDFGLMRRRRRRRLTLSRLALSQLAVPRKVAVPRHPLRRRRPVEPWIAEERKSKAAVLRIRRFPQSRPSKEERPCYTSRKHGSAD